jgi:hypothetical protein
MQVVVAKSRFEIPAVCRRMVEAPRRTPAVRARPESAAARRALARCVRRSRRAPRPRATMVRKGPARERLKRRAAARAGCSVAMARTAARAQADQLQVQRPVRAPWKIRPPGLSRNIRAAATFPASVESRCSGPVKANRRVPAGPRGLKRASLQAQENRHEIERAGVNERVRLFFRKPSSAGAMTRMQNWPSRRPALSWTHNEHRALHRGFASRMAPTTPPEPARFCVRGGDFHAAFEISRAVRGATLASAPVSIFLCLSRRSGALARVRCWAEPPNAPLLRNNGSPLLTRTLTTI